MSFQFWGENCASQRSPDTPGIMAGRFHAVPALLYWVCHSWGPFITALPLTPSQSIWLLMQTVMGTLTRPSRCPQQCSRPPLHRWLSPGLLAATVRGPRQITCQAFLFSRSWDLGLPVPHPLLFLALLTSLRSDEVCWASGSQSHSFCPSLSFPGQRGARPDLC